MCGVDIGRCAQLFTLFFFSCTPLSRGRGWITPLKERRQNKPVTDVVQAADGISLVGIRLEACTGPTVHASVNKDNRTAADVR